MNPERLRIEAAAQLAAEAIRLEGIQNEVIACSAAVPEALKDDLRHQTERHAEAVALVLRLSSQ